MENSSAASASSEAGSSRSQEIEELERFIDSYVLEYQVQGLLADKTEGDGESEKTQSHISQVSAALGRGLGRYGAWANSKAGEGTLHADSIWLPCLRLLVWMVPPPGHGIHTGSPSPTLWPPLFHPVPLGRRAVP